MRRAAISLIFGVILCCFPTALHADVVVDASLKLLQLQILPTAGTVQFVSPWTAQVAVHAEDSLSGKDDHSGSVTDANLTTLNATTALASAGGTASTTSVPFSANAKSGLNIPNIDASASSRSNGNVGFPAYSLSGEFKITGTTGSVGVVFQTPLQIDQ